VAIDTMIAEVSLTNELSYDVHRPARKPQEIP
jgi:hypothetical protein